MGTPRTGATVPRELVAPRHLGQPRTCHRGVSPPVSHSQGRGCPSATPRAPPKQHDLLEAAGAGAVASLQRLRPRSQPRFCSAGNAGVWGTGSVARRPSRQREGRWLAPWTNGARVWGWLCGRGLLCSRPAAEGRSPETLALPHSRATGQGMPAGQQACINCLEEAERAPCVFRSRPGDSTPPPHTHTQLHVMFQSNSAGWGGPRFQARQPGFKPQCCRLPPERPRREGGILCAPRSSPVKRGHT